MRRPRDVSPEAARKEAQRIRPRLDAARAKASGRFSEMMTEEAISDADLVNGSAKKSIKLR